MTEHTPDVVHLTLNEAFVSVFCFVSTSLAESRSRRDGYRKCQGGQKNSEDAFEMLITQQHHSFRSKTNNDTIKKKTIKIAYVMERSNGS